MIRAALAALALGGAALAAAAAPPAPPVSDGAIASDALPPTLDAFGFFADAHAQVPAAGVIPYRLNTALYSDGADKLRFLYLPPGAKASAAGEGLLALPVGSALIKTFAFGAGDQRRLIETRVLLHRASGWIALPYRWNEAQTEARLALAGGRVPVTLPGGETIEYAIPNKNQCKECHSRAGAVVPIGPKARNLSAAWLEGLHGAGKLDAVPAVAVRMPVWEERAAAGPALAARAYLDVNCGHCHTAGGSASNSGLDLTWEVRDPVALGVMKRPVAAGRGAGGHDFSILPGNPDASILVHRMASNEPGVAMPELGRATVDTQGLDTVRQWIAAMD